MRHRRSSLDTYEDAAPAIIGGSVYRGSAVPSLRDSYIFAEYGGGSIYVAQFDREAGTLSMPVNVTSSLGNIGGPSSIQTGNDGEIYVTALEEGALLKLIPAP